MINDLLLVNDDIVFDHSVMVVSDKSAILQCAIENMKIAYGEIPISSERGNKIYTKRVKLTDVNLPDIANDCKNAIMYDSRVKDVPSIKAVRNGIFGCDISFVITTVDGLSIQGTTSISLM